MSHLPAPQIAPRTKVVLESRQFSSPDRHKSHSHLHFAHSTRTISAEGCPRPGQSALSPACRALDTHDLRRGLPATGTNRTLACISRTRHARSPQRVARDRDKSHSRQHFAHSTRAISAEGCPQQSQIALSPAFCAPRHARSPQRVARDKTKSHSRLHFAHSTRTISAEGCPRQNQIALSPAFRALDMHDLRRGLRRTETNRTRACISRTRHARSPQRVAFRGGPAALPPALREKVKKSER